MLVVAGAVVVEVGVTPPEDGVEVVELGVAPPDVAPVAADVLVLVDDGTLLDVELVDVVLVESVLVVPLPAAGVDELPGGGSRAGARSGVSWAVGFVPPHPAPPTASATTARAASRCIADR